MKRGKRVFVVLAAALASGSSAHATPYAGTITFARARPSAITLDLTRARVTVSLAPGHIAHAVVPVRRKGKAVRFSLPGRPAPLVLDLTVKGKQLRGTARQGAARGTVVLTRGRTSLDTRLGIFRTDSALLNVIRFSRFNGGTPVAIDLATGAFGRAPGSAARVELHQEEVRFPSGNKTLAGTLTLPPGNGPFPAAVYVHGSGESQRDEAQFFGGLLLAHGIAVLAYDKRGIGQSGGTYLGDLASETAVAAYADDAAAAARFLAAQREIDRARVGFFGVSQAGWIIPLAAARAGATASWALIQSGPTVTQGESDLFGDLARGAGPVAELEARAHAAGPSGFDPAPWIARLTLPALWLYGAEDRNQPSGSSITVLRTLMPGHDFAYELFPSVGHSLFAAAGYAPGLFERVAAWLRAHGLAAA